MDTSGYDLGLNNGTEDSLSIHAGFPNPAADTRLQRLDLNKLLIQNSRSTFLFRVNGEQGVGRGIFDGDIVIVDRAHPALGNDLVLWHDGQTFKLSSPHVVKPGYAIWGVATAIIHQYS